MTSISNSDGDPCEIHQQSFMIGTPTEKPGSNSQVAKVHSSSRYINNDGDFASVAIQHDRSFFSDDEKNAVYKTMINDRKVAVNLKPQLVKEEEINRHLNVSESKQNQMTTKDTQIHYHLKG